jgi:hypothetical protein
MERAAQAAHLSFEHDLLPIMLRRQQASRGAGAADAAAYSLEAAK